MKCRKCKQCEMLITKAENVLKREEGERLYRVLTLRCPKCGEVMVVELSLIHISEPTRH